MIKNRVIVCSPGMEYFRVSELTKHNITRVSESEKSLIQYLTLKTLLIKSGCEVIDIPELKNHPNSVFTRDTSLVTPEGFVKLRMGLDSRRGEEDWMAKQLELLGIQYAGSIEDPGTAEGGDVILAGSVAFIGHSQRTNKEGIRQISEYLKMMGYEIRIIIVPPPHLHLGGAMSMIAPNRILCCKNIFPDDFFKGFERVETPMSTFISGNVICLAPDEVIAEQSNKETIQILRETGCFVHVIDLSEFISGTGGPSCMILPVKRTTYYPSPI